MPPTTRLLLSVRVLGDDTIPARFSYQGGLRLPTLKYARKIVRTVW